MRSTKIKKPLVEDNVATDIILKVTENWFPHLFTETALEVERNKKKQWQSSKIH